MAQPLDDRVEGRDASGRFCSSSWDVRAQRLPLVPVALPSVVLSGVHMLIVA
jgi:hypothetical protein